MEKWMKRAANLITSIAFGGQEKNTVVPYYPQKKEINGKEEPCIPRSIPEAPFPLYDQEPYRYGYGSSVR